MGKYPRRRPERLTEKLVLIRTSLGLSQNEIIARMGLNDSLVREEVSLFERGLREPPLQGLLEIICRVLKRTKERRGCQRLV